MYKELSDANRRRLYYTLLTRPALCDGQPIEGWHLSVGAAPSLFNATTLYFTVDSTDYNPLKIIIFLCS